MANRGKNTNLLMVGSPQGLLRCYWALCLLQIPSLPPEVYPLLPHNLDALWLSASSSSSYFWRLGVHPLRLLGWLHPPPNAPLLATVQPLGCAAGFEVLSPPHSLSHPFFLLQPTSKGCIWVFSQWYLRWCYWWTCPLAFGSDLSSEALGGGKDEVPNVHWHPQYQPFPLLHPPIHHDFSSCLFSLEGIWAEGV